MKNFWKNCISLFHRHDNNICARIPLDIKGRLYVSPMPFGPYDLGNSLFKIYKQAGVEFVVVLVTDDELKHKAKRDILSIYRTNNIEPIRFPIADYTSPDLHQTAKLVDKVSGYLKAGACIAVHCNAGVGRTGVIASCIVREIIKIPALDAMDYVKQYMKTEMTDEQIRLVKRYHTLAEVVEAKEQEQKQLQAACVH